MPPVQHSARNISIVAAVFTLLIWGCAGFLQLEAREATLAQAGQTALNLVLGLEHDIDRTISGYDLSLQATQRALQTPALTNLAPAMRDALLFDGSVNADDLGGINVLDSAGQLLYYSQGPDVRERDFSDREYFKAHVTDPAKGLLIGAPSRSRLDGQPVIALSRRLEKPDGTFAGVVVGYIRQQYFTKLFARFNLGEQGVLSLESFDGTLITRLPEFPGQAGAHLGAADVLRRMGSGNTVAYRQPSALDGINRLYTFRKVGPFPMLLGVGLGLQALYDDWFRQTVVIFLSLVVLTLFGGALVILLRGELASRRQSEQEARNAAAQLAVLTDHASDIMVHVAPDGRQRFVSYAWERLAGHTAAETVNADYLSFVHAEDRDRVAAAFAITMMGGDAGLLAYRMCNDGGGCRNVEANCRALPNDDGAIFVIRDVTERTRLESRLHQAQRMEAVGQLTAGVAHDFNNMLQAQVSSLEQLGDQVTDRPASLQLVHHAMGLAERGARMTHQLLSFSRQQVLRPTPVSLAQLLPAMAMLFQQMLGSRIQVSSAVAAGTPSVLVDASYLEVALLNLALNARDAMPDGGQLMLQASRQDDLASEMPGELERSRRYVVLLVIDDGGGMDETTVRRACEPFFTTKGVNGTGLGLPSAQGFARQSGGELRVSSVVGLGTRVEIWLPVSDVRARPPAAPAETRRSGSARVLLVDDEPGVLEAVGSCLRNAGFCLEEACDAEAALEVMAGSDPFDALVTDFLLPGRDGADLVEQARETCPGIATLVITGWAGTERLQHLPAQTEVIYKPFKRDELISRLRRAIAATAPLAEPAAQRLES